ncbi:MAG: hypothetical protein QXS93_02855 [Candidatus Micrarchaeia archaeon]
MKVKEASLEALAKMSRSEDVCYKVFNAFRTGNISAYYAHRILEMIEDKTIKKMTYENPDTTKTLEVVKLIKSKIRTSIPKIKANPQPSYSSA